MSRKFIVAVAEVQMPYESKMNEHIDAVHYFDSFETQCRVTTDLSPEVVLRLLLSNPPLIIKKLMVARNGICQLIGLKSVSLSAAQLKEYKVGEPIPKGKVFIFYKSDNELILGANDSHLDFRVSLLLLNANQKIIVTTAVCFHNAYGKAYFAVVKPFHKLIVKSLLSNSSLTLTGK